MELNVLLGLLGVFAMVSGWLKSRARVREYMGGAGLGVIELLAGFVLLIVQGPNMAEQGTRILVGWATGGIMVFSNLYAVVRARSVTRRRVDSEGRRLYTQVKYEQALKAAGVENPDDAEPWEVGGVNEAADEAREPEEPEDPETGP